MYKQGILSVTDVVISRKERPLSLQARLLNCSYTVTFVHVIAPARVQWLSGGLGLSWRGGKQTGGDRWEKPVSLVPKGKKKLFCREGYWWSSWRVSTTCWMTNPNKNRILHTPGDRSNMLSMKVLWVEWWWKSVCLSLICKRVKKPLMVVLQIFIDFSCSFLCFFLLLMKYAVKGALLNTVSASVSWEACRILNVLWLNFITLKLHRGIYEPYCSLIWNEPRKVLLLL